MRLRDLRYCLALLFLHPLGAAETLVASNELARFDSTDLGHVVLVRDKEAVPRSKFPLPPGGEKLSLQQTASTPYDAYFGSVRAAIAELQPKKQSMATAAHLMTVGNSFLYYTRDPYRPDPPRLTEVQRAGDCKSKALWLYSQLADDGALFTIGKSEKNSRTSHAWVYWRYEGKWYILDCTDGTDIKIVDQEPPNLYVPYYSFGKFGTYRHPAAQIGPIPVAEETPPKAVGRKKSR